MSGRKSSSSSKLPANAPDQASSSTSQMASVQTSSSGKPGRSTREAASRPEMFGRYRIEKVLGQGAMGIVYLAEDTQLGRKVALKIPQRSALEDPVALDRFYREAQTSSQIRHPHICPVYDVGAIDGTHYLTMAYIPGKPISCFLGKGKLPPPKAVAALFRKLALALAEAHKQGVIHRDLKPSNVMLDDRNEPVIMDFGLARQFNTQENARLTQSGAIVGTPAYMSPEQARDEGSIGPQSDVYSLGVMLYQFLTDELPFEGPTMMVLAQILTTQPPRPAERRSDVDPRLEAICLSMMARDPSQRFASMQDVAKALGAYLKGTAETPVLGGSSPFEFPVPPASGKSSQAVPISSGAKSFRVRNLILGGTAVLLLLIGLVVFWIVGPSSVPDPGDADNSQPIHIADHDVRPPADEASPAEPMANESETSVDLAPPDDETPEPARSAVTVLDNPLAVEPTGTASDDAEDSSTDLTDETMEDSDESAEEMTNDAPEPPPETVVAPRPPSKSNGKSKARGSGNKNSTRRNSNNRGSAGKKKPPMPRIVPPKQPPPPLSETEQSFAQYDEAVQAAYDELVNRFDRAIKDIDKSTKLSREEKDRLIADLRAERETFTTRTLIPFSTQMRKHAETYCAAMNRAGKSLLDRLHRYGAKPEAIEDAQERTAPRLVGIWRCETSEESFKLRLMSNLKLDSDVASRQGSWTFDENVLNLKFTDPNAPGGIWHYKCKMNASGQGFTAGHVKAAEIKGVLGE